MTTEQNEAAEGEATATLLKKKTKPVKAAKSEDVILQVANLVENMNEAQVIEYIDNAMAERDFCAFKAGAGLVKMQTEGWKGQYESFKAYVEENMAFKVRKAGYLMALYNGLVEANVKWEEVAHIKWLKLAAIAPILTEENKGEWIAKAEVATLLQIREMVAAYKKATVTDEGKDKVTNDFKPITLKFHPDQYEQFRMALDKAKAEAQTEFDNVAAEAIATGYLTGSVQIAKSTMSLKEMMEQVGDPKAVLMTFEQVFPNINIEVTEPEDGEGEEEIV
jgi:hypothetical protein